MINKKFEFQCCFYNKNIQEDAVDPVDMNIIFNADMKNKTDSFSKFLFSF